MTTTQQNSPAPPRSRNDHGGVRRAGRRHARPARRCSPTTAPPTYRELAANATAVAAVLRGGGTGPVALLCRHGVTTISAMLGALAAGRPYVPLDPTFPVRRLAFQLADSGATALLTDADNAALAGVRRGRRRPGTGRRRPRRSPMRPLWTSTGLPSTRTRPPTCSTPPAPPARRRACGRATATWCSAPATTSARFGIGPADRTGVLTSFGFDMAVTDTFAALLSGAAAAPIDIRARGLGAPRRGARRARRDRLPLDADRLPLPRGEPRRADTAARPRRGARRRGGDRPRRARSAAATWAGTACSSTATAPPRSASSPSTTSRRTRRSTTACCRSAARSTASRSCCSARTARRTRPRARSWRAARTSRSATTAAPS